MNTINQKIKLEEGDSLTLIMPTGEQIEVGFGGDGQVPSYRPWVITSVDCTKTGFSNDHAFTITPTGEFKGYQLK